MSLETEDATMVDNCPERVAAADVEPPMPPRIETAVEFWSGLAVETVEEATMLSLETAVLRRFFWRSKKKKQKQEAADEC